MAELTEWNIQDYLKTVEDVRNFLESALEEKDNEFLVIAVKDAIKALKTIEGQKDVAQEK